MNDVNPQRSIRNVPVSTRRRAAPDPEYVREHVPPAFRGDGSGGYRPVQPPRRRFWPLAVGAVLVCAAAGAGLSLLFTGATITVVPRTATVTPAEPVQATRTCAEAQCAPAIILYREITASASTSRSTAASGSREVATAAAGTITIFNNHSTSPQTLVATTRFESPTGRIYRIREDIVVPGGKKDADGKLTPGKITAVVYADKPGPEYNTGKTQFSIPGFKGKPQYNGFYATTEGLSGGTLGLQPTVLPADIEKAKADMAAELENRLTNDVTGKVGEGQILLPGALSILYGEVQISAGQSGNATVSLSAEAVARAIEANALAGAVAYGAVEGYAGQTVGFGEQPSLSVSADFTDPSSPYFTITFDDPVTLKWQVDSEAIVAAVAGKEKDAFEEVMSQFKPAVASASAALHPFWLSTFPSDSVKIKVKIKMP